MSVDFSDLPAGTPSVTPVSSGTGYCSASTVASLNKARVVGQGKNPTWQDIDGYILMVAGQIDSTLRTKGYEVPVNTASFPEMEGLLAWANATGAWAMMEAASPQAPNIDRAEAAYKAAMGMLADAKLSLDSPVNVERGEVRAPWLTFQPPTGTYDPAMDVIRGVPGDGISSGDAQRRRRLPFFSRGMRF